MTPAHHDAATEVPLQPLLDAAVVALRAPTQVWSGADGAIGDGAIDGVFHGDVRHARVVEVSVEGSGIEWISAAPDGPSRIVFGGLLRGLDDPTPDPKVRIVRDRVIAPGSVRETLRIASHLAEPVDTVVSVRIVPEFALLHEVKSGLAHGRPWTRTSSDGSVTADAGAQRMTVVMDGADVRADDEAITVSWPVQVPAHGVVERTVRLDLHDAGLVVGGGGEDAPWDARSIVAQTSGDPRLGRWLEVALGDLDALRLALPDHPEDEFFAAGAPWFFTLFGRDSIWAARLALPLGPGLAASTLRVLARLQGASDDPETAQEPGKILHELRATSLELPGEGIELPPLYYGSVDSTPLWVCLLVDAWRRGVPDDTVQELIPALVGALRWILEHGDSDGDGFLDYVDRTGRGLANQGWKDSGDSIQWRDGTLAEGPIALCEVQAYAYEAALGGADVLEAFGASYPDAPTPDALRAWARALRERFADAFWVETPEGRYPAVALDRTKRPVDTLTSNIGHLIGTGILDADDEKHVAGLLRGPSMSSGYGVRTMSTASGGYWPLSYHGGSVWMHDTAIAVHGMLRAGLVDDAQAIAAQMLDAAEGFAFRVPELHAGDPSAESAAPVPYPAACRPQAWSAAAAIVAREAAQA